MSRGNAVLTGRNCRKNSSPGDILVNEEDVIRRINEGWAVYGDIGEDMPFGLIDTKKLSADFVSSISVEIVRNVFDRGILQNPQPGKVALYSRKVQFSMGS
jgi:hypothetical protein